VGLGAVLTLASILLTPVAWFGKRLPVMTMEARGRGRKGEPKGEVRGGASRFQPKRCAIHL
jgi:hypothetical protein